MGAMGVRGLWVELSGLICLTDRQGHRVSYEKSLFGKSLLEQNIPAFVPDYITRLIQQFFIHKSRDLIIS